MRFESQYASPLPEAVSRDGKTIAFRVTRELGFAIDKAAEESGFRYTSEWIRKILIDEIERVISAS